MSNPSIGEVCLLGVGIVFVGLVSIVLLCLIIGAICRRFEKGGEGVASAVPAAVSQEIPNRQQFVAAVSAAIAEELGKDISAIRIHSIKKL